MKNKYDTMSLVKVKSRLTEKKCCCDVTMSTLKTEKKNRCQHPVGFQQQLKAV